MSKKVSFGTIPTAKTVDSNPDEWVESRANEGNKRLTLDLPASLHTRIKVACVMKGVKMVDEIRELLERHFPKANS
jgi:hypothetical protein